MKSLLVIGSGGLMTRTTSKSDTPLPSVSPWTSQIGPPSEIFSKRSSPAVLLKAALPMKLNAWSPASRRVGVDPRQVDQVAGVEVLDAVAFRRVRLRHRIVAEDVVAGAAGQGVAPQPAEDQVGAGAAGQHVVAGAAEEPEVAVRLVASR